MDRSHALLNNGFPASSEASSSSSVQPRRISPRTHNDDEIDLLGDEADIADDDPGILGDDPLHDDDQLPLPSSHKRKQQSGILSQPSRLLSGLSGGGGGSSSAASPRNDGSSLAPPTPSSSSGLPLSRSNTPLGGGRSPIRSPHRQPPPTESSGSGGNGSNAGRSNNNNNEHPNHQSSLSKDHFLAQDWYVEGPGRRVGYEDLTAIDWIFEYTKERQRLRVLVSGSSSSGASGQQQLLGYARQLLDASQVWVILVLAGLAVGTLAAAIDVTADWLGDVKAGYCASGPDGGAFYLNKGFCCFGYDEWSKCVGWRPWAAALGIASATGKWIVEYIFFLLFSVTFALCANILVREYALYAKHSGIPEIKTVLGGFIIRRLLGTWTLVTKSLGLCLAVASGMWLGKEGPLVHVACCCANILIKPFPSINNNEARKREVLSAAAASGISVAFGSPIGGVLFSLEQLSYYFPDKTMWQSFVCAMTAAVTLQAFDPFRSGKLVMYQVKYTTGWHAFEMLPFAFLGIIGGIYGGLFIKANMWVAQWKKTTSWLPGPTTQVILVALLTAVINYPNIYMRAQNSELVSSLFAECSQLLDDQFGLCKTGAASAGTIVLLIFASMLGFFLASITFGLQIPAGIILPSMAIGALSGRAVGIIMEIWQHNHPNFLPFQSCEPDVACVTPGTYAIIGAAASLAGVTRMTVSIVVIMFELTGALTYVLPIMIAVMVSKWVGDAFSRRGIYESWIHFNEYPFLDNSEEMVIPDIPAAQIMTRIEDLVVLTAVGHTIGSLRRVLDTHRHRGFPVVSDPRDAILLGYISRAELAYNLHTCTQPPRSLPPETEAFFSHQPMADPRVTLDLRPWMDQTPITLSSRASLHLAVSYFQKLGLRYVLFSDRGALQGLLTKKDVWYVLNGAEETRRTSGGTPGMGVETGITREDGEGEQRGLLRSEGAEDDEEDPASPGANAASIL